MLSKTGICSSLGCDDLSVFHRYKLCVAKSGNKKWIACSRVVFSFFGALQCNAVPACAELGLLCGDRVMRGCMQNFSLFHRCK